MGEKENGNRGGKLLASNRRALHDYTVLSRLEVGIALVGTEVKVVPMVDKTARYKAVVNEINPMVDAQGTVTLRARLTTATDLFDGMNVEVIRIPQIP